MTTKLHKPRLAAWVALAAGAFATAGLVPVASYAQPAEDSAAAPLSRDELDDLVGRIALYPDDLIGIVLPASTYPLQVVQAGRFLEQRAKNPSLKPDKRWDDSVVALLNYPEVVKLMNDDLDWTSALGEAVANQRADVLDAIQGFRDRAYAAGNLKSDDRQVVKRENDEISIAPANPEVIYVPYYEPERVVVYQTVPVFDYYPWAYPVYYYPYPVGYRFDRFETGFFWGVSTAFLIGWHSHDLHIARSGFFGHPYYGHTYYDPFYVRNNVNINVNIVNTGGRSVWEPRYRHPARPIVVGRDHRAPQQRGDAGGSYRPGGTYRSGSGADTRRVDPRSATRGADQPLGGNAANAAERARRAGQQPQQTAPTQQPNAQGQAPDPRTNDRRYTQPRSRDQGAARGTDNRSGEDAASKRGGPQTRFQAPAPQSSAPTQQAAPQRETAPRYERGLGRSPAQTAPRAETRQFTPPPDRNPGNAGGTREYRVERPAPSASPRAMPQSGRAYGQASGDRGGAAAAPTPRPPPRDGGARANAPGGGRAAGGGQERGASHREVLRGGQDRGNNR